MALSPNNPNMRSGRQSAFLFKMNSALEPDLIGDGYVHYAYNMTNERGGWQTRPLFKPMFKVLSGTAQGGCLFTPKNSNPIMVLAISGRIYAVPFPFVSAHQLPNLLFNAHVDLVTFKVALVAKDALGLIDPYPVLIIQDGRTRPGVYDGSANYHSDPGAGGIPIGLAMEWAGHRLWVERGRKRDYVASDIYNPLSFVESQYFFGGGSFQALDGLQILALKVTADDNQLFVMTAENTDAIDASNTDRDSWKTDKTFLRRVFSNVGIVGPKAIDDRNGELQWMSFEGFRRFNQVGANVRSSKVAIASHEMKKSYDQVSRNVMNRICVGGFGSRTHVSVPAGSLRNRHTWIFDTSHNDLLLSQTPPGWDGVWTGIFPVDWMSGDVAGRKRCFAISNDPDAVRVWECYVSDRESEERDSILSFIDTRLQDCREPDAFKKFAFGRLTVDIRGDVQISASYRTDYGCFNSIGLWNLCAKTCMEFPSDCETPPIPFDRQRRYLTTEEGKDLPRLDGMQIPGNVARSFGLRLFGMGLWRLNDYDIFARQYEEPTKGECSTGDTAVVCSKLSCCDAEPNYVSVANDGGGGNYYYGGDEGGIVFPDEGGGGEIPPGPDLLTGLGAFWSMEEATGNDDRVDASGNGAHLTAQFSPVQVAGKVDFGVEIGTGGGFRLYRPHDAPIAMNGIDWTIAGWWNPRLTGVPSTNIISKQAASANGWNFSVSPGAGLFCTFTVMDVAIATGQLATAEDTWVFLLMSFNNSTLTGRILIQKDDGTVMVDTSGVASGPITETSADFKLGDNYNSWFDCLGFWRKVLSAPEEAEFFNSGDGIQFPF